jgi:hypothetical protein
MACYHLVHLLYIKLCRLSERTRAKDVAQAEAEAAKAAGHGNSPEAHLMLVT